MKKTFICNFFKKSKLGAILEKAFKLSPVFYLYVKREFWIDFDTWKLLTCTIVYFFIFNNWSHFLLVAQIKRHMSGFLFTWLLLNHWKCDFQAFCSLTISFSILFRASYGVLPSAQLTKPMLFFIKKRSQWKRVNKGDPNIDPWGTPNKISFRELYSALILVLYFRFERWFCISLKAIMLNPYPFSFALKRSCKRQWNSFERSARRVSNTFFITESWFPFLKQW